MIEEKVMETKTIKENLKFKFLHKVKLKFVYVY